MTSDDDRPEVGADLIARQAETMLELALYWHFKYLDISNPLERARAWAALIDQRADLSVAEIRFVIRSDRPETGC